MSREGKNNDSKVFQHSTGEWGSKGRKQDGYKRRNSMKQATRDELVAQLLETASEKPKTMPEEMFPGDRLTRLENEVKELKQELKRWKAKAEAAYKQWMKDLWREYRHGHKPPEIELELERIQTEWENIKNAGNNQ